MDDTRQDDGQVISRDVGGEAGHRGFFGGTGNKTRTWLLLACGLVFLFTAPTMGTAGIILPAVAAAAVFLLTAGTHRGSILDRHRRAARWRDRQRCGTDRYTPYDVAAWDQATQALNDRGLGRQERDAAARRVAAMRTMPDGADGMGWLQMGRRTPGIAWHAPAGEDPYLSVAFAVTGQLRGQEPGRIVRRAGEAFGQFLADHGPASSLVRAVQVTTRVLPPDSAFYEAWAQTNLDPDLPAAHPAVASYRDVLALTGRDAMVQRHTITLSWPITPAFRDAAGAYGAGRDGWRALMDREIDAATAALRAARLGDVAALTARQLAGRIRHAQDPSWPLDRPAQDPMQFGVASHDEFAAHVVDGQDPATGRPAQWWHRTAAVTAAGLAVGPRSQLWLLDLLTGQELGFIRTVTFHHRLVPAAEARAAARRDLVRDRAAAIADAEKGRLVNDQTETNRTAAQRRNADLRYGSAHHGDDWVAYITITTRSRDQLRTASRRLADVAQTSLGIERLDWLDSYQSAASGCTWPIGRGIRPARLSLAGRGVRILAGKRGRDDL